MFGLIFKNFLVKICNKFTKNAKLYIPILNNKISLKSFN